MSTFTIVITIAAAFFFGAFVLFGAWIDGRRQALRDKGLHPVTTPDGTVTAQEYQDQEHQEPAHGNPSSSTRTGTGHDTSPRRVR